VRWLDFVLSWEHRPIPWLGLHQSADRIMDERVRWNPASSASRYEPNIPFSRPAVVTTGSHSKICHTPRTIGERTISRGVPNSFHLSQQRSHPRTIEAEPPPPPPAPSIRRHVRETDSASGYPPPRPNAPRNQTCFKSCSASAPNRSAKTRSDAHRSPTHVGSGLRTDSISERQGFNRREGAIGRTESQIHKLDLRGVPKSWRRVDCACRKPRLRSPSIEIPLQDQAALPRPLFEQPNV